MTIQYAFIGPEVIGEDGTYPEPVFVIDKVLYGPTGSEYEGTYQETDPLDVRQGVLFGPDGAYVGLLVVEGDQPPCYIITPWVDCENCRVKQGTVDSIEFRPEAAGQWPNLAGATIEFVASNGVERIVLPGTIVNPSNDQLVVVDFPQGALDTPSGYYGYDLHAVYGETKELLAQGQLQVMPSANYQTPEPEIEAAIEAATKATIDEPTS